MNPRTHIIATIGPACESQDTFFSLIEGGADLIRMNFAWQTPESTARYVALIHEAELAFGKKIPIIADLPGPRVQQGHGHTYTNTLPALTEHDRETLAWCAQEHIAYVALSFVGSAQDIATYREVIDSLGGTQKIIAKIERKAALDSLESIIAAADAAMVARGDLGEEIPLEQVPFAQQDIVRAANQTQKPVIVATQMLYSMTKSPEPTRAEVTDVEEAVAQGADAVMLSDETASGLYPQEAVRMMDKIIRETEKRITRTHFHSLI